MELVTAGLDVWAGRQGHPIKRPEMSELRRALMGGGCSYEQMAQVGQLDSGALATRVHEAEWKLGMQLAKARNGKGTWIRWCFNPTPYPVELATDRSGGYLSLNSRDSIVRWVDDPSSLSAEPLLAASHSDDLLVSVVCLEDEHDVKEIAQGLADELDCGRVVAGVPDKASEHHIVVLFAHGHPGTDKDQTDLALKLADLSSIRVAFLVVCHAAEGLEKDAGDAAEKTADAFATTLVKNGIPVVVAFLGEVTNSAGAMAASTFCTSVKAGNSVDDAVLAARIELQTRDVSSWKLLTLTTSTHESIVVGPDRSAIAAGTASATAAVARGDLKRDGSGVGPGGGVLVASAGKGAFKLITQNGSVDGWSDQPCAGGRGLTVSADRTTVAWLDGECVNWREVNGGTTSGNLAVGGGAELMAFDVTRNRGIHPWALVRCGEHVRLLGGLEPKCLEAIPERGLLNLQYGFVMLATETDAGWESDFYKTALSPVEDMQWFRDLPAAPIVATVNSNSGGFVVSWDGNTIHTLGNNAGNGEIVGAFSGVWLTLDCQSAPVLVTKGPAGAVETRTLGA